MDKWEEARLKFVLITDDFILTRRKFNSVKKKLKVANKTLNELLNKTDENDDYIDELTYDTYLKWYADYHKNIAKRYFDLIANINNAVLQYFNDTDKTYTTQEVKKILSDNDIYNAEKGFGGFKDYEQ